MIFISLYIDFDPSDNEAELRAFNLIDFVDYHLLMIIGNQALMVKNSFIQYSQLVLSAYLNHVWIED